MKYELRYQKTIGFGFSIAGVKFNALDDEQAKLKANKIIKKFNMNYAGHYELLCIMKGDKKL